MVMTPICPSQSQPVQGTAPAGGVTFYNPAQFAQVRKTYNSFVVLISLFLFHFRFPFPCCCFVFLTTGKCTIGRWTPLRSSGWSAPVPSVEINIILRDCVNRLVGFNDILNGSERSTWTYCSLSKGPFCRLRRRA